MKTQGFYRLRAASSERFKLIGGPYRPPRAKRGGFLYCRLRGWVQVDGYTQAPIPWPAKWGRSPLLCGDLVKAVKREAKASVAYYWGVSVITVYKWRKALGVEWWPEGSRKLMAHSRRTLNIRRTAKNPELRKSTYALVKEANPRRRSKAFRALMRKRMRERLKETGVLDPRRKAWTRTEQKLLGVLPDREVAKRSKRTVAAVMTRRRHLRKKSPTSSWKHWSAADIQALGSKPDKALAKELGRHISAIGAKRRKLKIPQVGRPTMRPWTPEEEALLRDASDEEVAKKTGRTLNSIYIHRRGRGFPRQVKLRRWTPAEKQLLFGGTAAELALRLKRRSKACKLSARY